MPGTFQTAETLLPSENNVSSEKAISDVYLSNIILSRFEAQKLRRANLNDETLRELAESIAANGLLQPIVVRPYRAAGTGTYEIVFGERRYLASQLIGLEKIECRIREMSDAKALTMQYLENHQREESNPIEDALRFKDLKEKAHYSNDDIANEFGIRKSEIEQKLQLLKLIPEAAKELSEKRLPLRHAYLLATYPRDSQVEIVREQYAYRHYDREEKAVSFDVFKAEVEQNIERRLPDAPFDVADPRLHVKALLCRDCPDNSANQTYLFPELAKTPTCLNKTCFQTKTNTYLRLRREDIAATLPNPNSAPMEEIVRQVPLVTRSKWIDERATPFREKIHTGQKYFMVPECEFSVPSLILNPNSKAEHGFTCRNDKCPIHNPKPEIDEEDLTQMETDFDERVAQRVRLKILQQAMQWFDDRRIFWQFDDLIRNLIVEFLFARTETHADVLWLVRDWKNVPKNFNDKEKLREFVANFDKREQSQILFLLSSIGADELEILDSARVDSNINFFLLDAETRLELAPDEFKLIAAHYYERVKNGVAADVPRFWQNYDDVPEISGEEN